MTTRDDQEDEALALELRAADALSSSLRDALARILRDATARYVKAAGSIDNPLPEDARRELTRWLARRIGSLAVGGVAEQLRRFVLEALGLGAEHAQVWTGPVAVALAVEPETEEAIGGLEALLRSDLREAAAFARTLPVENYADVTAIAAKANQAVNRVESTARWATNRALNSGVTRVTASVGAERMWVPERDGCLHCLAYAGEVTSPHHPFPAGLTFGDKPIAEEPVENPPLHPWCRCRVVPWLGSDDPEGGLTAPEALQREARRSVLQGKTFGSEASRIRAADRLLTEGANLPKSVEAKARIAVSAGKF